MTIDIICFKKGAFIIMNDILSIIVHSFTSNMELFLRILISVICGGIIGIERTKRQKEAGIRTHIIVAMGSTLIMIVSKYGCLDIFTTYGINVDSTRIASNIVTGIGFLGAGVIFVRGASIKGLTTAAGIWTTAGVGMAIGTGMYAIGIFSTIVITIIQFVLHKWNLSVSDAHSTHEITVTFESSTEAQKSLLEYLEGNEIFVQDFGITKSNENNTTTLKLSVRMINETKIQETIDLFDKIPELISYKISG